MFIQATNKSGKVLIINVDAIAYVDFDKEGVLESLPTPNKTIKPVRIYFRLADGKKGDLSLHYEEFRGETAQKLREELPRILQAESFDV